LKESQDRAFYDEKSPGDDKGGGGALLTVRPFLRVVDCVFAPAGEATGVAKPLLMERRAEGAARARRPCPRLRASLRDAIDAVQTRWMGGGSDETEAIAVSGLM